MGYLRRTSNYPERISLSNPNHMMSKADPIAIGVKTLRIDSGCFMHDQVGRVEGGRSYVATDGR